MSRAEWAPRAQPCPLSLRPQGLFSSVVCPGTMLTNLTYGILPRFVWTLMMPIIWLVSARPARPLCKLSDAGLSVCEGWETISEIESGGGRTSRPWGIEVHGKWPLLPTS